MNVLVVNIGSTSFKFRLLNMADETVLASGSVEGVGGSAAKGSVQFAGTAPQRIQQPVHNQAAAVAWCLAVLGGRFEIDAVGFKAVHGGDLPEAVCINPDMLRVMEEFADAAPAHNPAYIAAMRAFQQQMPATPLVAAFETGFHRTIPAARTTYAIPYEWTTEYGIRRYGFHGASHRYVAQRTAELLGWNAARQTNGPARIISCHLGGSSSLCAIDRGKSIATSMGLTPQTGLPQNNRVGDFDAFALLRLRARTGLDYEALLAHLARQGGLLGVSGFSNDMADILAAAADAAHPDHARAALALGIFVESVRDYIGAYIVALGGLDALVFTGGIGERAPEIRQRVCAGLDFLGIRLDPARNTGIHTGAGDAPDALVSSADSPVSVLALRTNEELVVARQTVELLRSRGQVARS